jgi:hypothetical protein
MIVVRDYISSDSVICFKVYVHHGVFLRVNLARKESNTNNHGVAWITEAHTVTVIVQRRLRAIFSRCI